MSINILMPALSPTMEEGTLAKWLVKQGDSVTSGDIIAEIETDKATMEVEAVDEGTVGKLMVAEGTEGVKVNAVIAILAEEGEDPGSVEAASNAPGPAAAPEPAAAPAPAPASETTAAAAPVAPTTTPAAASGDRLFSSPLARRIASQNSLDLTKITGSGPRGRIVKSDVEAALAGGSAVQTASAPAAAAPTPAAAPTGPGDDAVRALFAADSFEERPHNAMRKVVAQRLTESSQTIPAYFVSMDCELDKLLALRKQMNDAAPTDADGKPHYKLSVNDFIVKALALALQTVPEANASWTTTARLMHKHSDVGVAVAIPDGLFTPIVRKAEQKTLSAISAEVKDMARRARDKKLAPEEYQGGTTAVSNLGMFGVDNFTSIINPPHASIVSIGTGAQKPVVKDGELSVATVMNATFAFDHRVIDGALGAELASKFKGFIEQPMSMLV